jgi:hypothetical protein
VVTRDGVKVAMPIATVFTAIGPRVPGTTVAAYSVAAFDAGGNVGLRRSSAL